MPSCSYVKSFDITPENGRLKVVVSHAGDRTIKFSDIVEATFPGIPISREADTGTGILWTLTTEETFWVDATEDDVDELKSLLRLLSQHVTIQDSLDESHALALHNLPVEDEWRRTNMGKLVNRAKDYYGESAWRDTKATLEICDHIVEFIQTHPRYNSANAIAPAPSSNPGKTLTLPGAVARAVSKHLSKQLFVPRRARAIPSQKDYDDAEAEGSREDLQAESVVVDESLEGMTIVAIDDLYESGGTLNEVARACRDAGARAVLGLAMTKTAKYTQGMDIAEWPWE